MMMLYVVLIAKWLGAVNYSIIAASYAIASITSVFYNWGFNEWLMRFGSLSVSPRHLGGSVILFKFSVGIIWSMILYFVLPLWNPDLYLPNLLVLILIDVWSDGIFNTLLVILFCETQINKASFLLVISRTLRLIGGIALIFLEIKSVKIFISVRLLSTLFVFCLSWYFAKPVISRNKGLASWRLFMEAATFNSFEFLAIIYIHTDVTLLSLFYPNRVVISNYSILIGLLNAIMTLPMNIYYIILGSMVKIYKNNISQFFVSIRKVKIGFALSGMMMFIGMIILGVPVIKLVLGEGYRESGEILMMLSPLILLKTVSQGLITYLVVVGLQFHRLISQTFVVIFKLGFGILVVIQWQVVGVIAIHIISDLFFLISCLYWVIRHYYSYRKSIMQ